MITSSILLKRINKINKNSYNINDTLIELDSKYEMPMLQIKRFFTGFVLFTFDPINITFLNYVYNVLYYGMICVTCPYPEYSRKMNSHVAFISAIFKTDETRSMLFDTNNILTYENFVDYIDKNPYFKTVLKHVKVESNRITYKHNNIDLSIDFDNTLYLILDQNVFIHNFLFYEFNKTSHIKMNNFILPDNFQEVIFPFEYISTQQLS